MEYQHFLNLFTENLSKHVPWKKKSLKGNQVRFITKDLHKAIMTRFILRSKFLHNKTEASQKENKNQQNFCSNLLWKDKKDYFGNLQNLLSQKTKVCGKL